MAETKTYHDGAREERACWLNKVKRMFKERPESAALDVLLAWGLTRRKRYEAEPGGLGRKKKV